MPIDESPLSIDPNILRFMFEDGDANYPHANQPRLSVFADEMARTVVDEEPGHRDIVPHQITQSVAETLTKEEVSIRYEVSHREEQLLMAPNSNPTSNLNLPTGKMSPPPAMSQLDPWSRRPVMNLPPAWRLSTPPMLSTLQ